MDHFAIYLLQDYAVLKYETKFRKSGYAEYDLKNLL